MGGCDDLRDNSSMWKLIAVRLMSSRVAMVNLCHKIILFGKRTKQNIGLAVIDELLPKVLQPQPQLVHGGGVVHWVATWFHGVVEQFVATSTAGFFGVCAETLL